MVLCCRLFSLFGFVWWFGCLQAQPLAAEFFKKDYEIAFRELRKLKPLLQLEQVPDLPRYLLTSTDSIAVTDLAACIVFPELVRYSRFKDFLETRTLELFYVSEGAEAADFSIGYFQMRPSFVETLECLYENLNKKYLSLKIPLATNSEMRRVRLARMQHPKWQTHYLLAFLAVAYHKFPSQLFANSEKLIGFYAAYYNLGLRSSFDEVQRWLPRKAYPMGARFTGTQYSYAVVATDFYCLYVVSRKF